MSRGSFLLILAVVNTPAYVVLGWLFFGSWSGFVEGVWRGLTTSSQFREENWEEGWWALLKLLFLIIAGGSLIGAEYALATPWLKTLLLD